ncbi:hypothetical protein [Mangrovimonas sp. YM274]|uniref:hypothetical protein n=1 Tax=Mangrovimonas sp. YM274 TaxID=3070660 RepID=UPI0027DC4E6D|nr:hypothetical protein [Mangrovimonas sp. YM274]WMI70255.1 hypothetical protein RBH95_07850 [Mangrovimonas sp. YM274]
MQFVENKKALSQSEINQLFDKFFVDASRAQVEHGHISLVYRTIQSLINLVRLIYGKLQKDPRFNWVIIQNDIDELYRKDNSINQYNITLIIEESDEPNIGSLVYLIKKSTI